MSSEWIPVVSAVVGGLLTVVGGFLGNFFLQSIARQADKRKVMRDELEQIYLLSQQVVDWAVKEMQAITKGYIGGNFDDSSQREDSQIDKLLMLVRFYQPQLLPDAQKLADIVKEFQSGTVTFWLAVAQAAQAGQQIPRESFENAIRPVDEIQRLREQLVASIATNVQKYI